ncbi:MAG TPA: tartrate-resistant acid phosphatase type 5 family protein [Rhodothermales bacterium]|nr:tartrate-resistant acid phosphatase type 5 family protein [Rhodothermales bacterium]
MGLRHPLKIIALLWLLTGAGCYLSWDSLDVLDPSPDAFDQDAFNFMVVGDWGRGGWFWQDDVAEAMGGIGAEINSRFVISTGDNFYEDGVASVADGKWQSSFENVYTAPSLQTPWYAVLGNHDHRGNIQAQIDYTDQSDRWTMPARYYAFTQPIDDSTTALFAFLDTEVFVFDDPAEVTQQQRWLDSTLANTEAQWKIVVGHHNLYAVRAGHGNSSRMQRAIEPLMEKHSVTAYLCGHVHSLQHLQPEGSSIDYLVSGAGSLAYKLEEPSDGALFAAASPGFLAVSLTPEAMHVRFFDYRGRVGYAAEVESRPSTPKPVPVAEPVL